MISAVSRWEHRRADRRAGAATIAMVCLLAYATPAAASPRQDPSDSTVEIAARVLVLDDRQPMTGALIDRLEKEGVPYTRIDLGSAVRPQLTESFLVTTRPSVLRANFMGVIAPTETPMSLSDEERATLAAYERTFKVREADSYTWANPGVGLDYTSNGGYDGAVDGMTATVTDTGKASGFSYLKGPVPLDNNDPNVVESFGYLASPMPATSTSSFTPLLTATIPGTDRQGSLLGVYAKEGREQLISTFASNASQQHFKTLAHGIITWVTRGVSLSSSRNYFSVHIDDVLLPDAEWSNEGNCTIDDDCDPAKYPPDAAGATSRMKAADVDALEQWQATSGVKQDLAFNGAGATDAKNDNGGTDALENALLAKKSAFRWINHTWSHLYLGCAHDNSTSPWSCVSSPNGDPQWAMRQTIESEIRKNTVYAAQKALPAFPRDVLVTGEHSGLRSLPQMSADNPNLAPALQATGVTWVASDASRERDPRLAGRAVTVPRHPMNIFYNTSTKAGAVDEYNWIYTARKDGGSGLCEDNPDVSTCIAPLGEGSFDSYIVPREKQIALDHMLDNDARPHYAHQSNLTNDRILYPVLDSLFSAYRTVFADNAPIVNLTMKEAGAQLLKQQNWEKRESEADAVVRDRTMTVRNTSTTALELPVTLPAGSTSLGRPLDQNYGDQASTWTTLGAKVSRTFTMPQAPGFALRATWPEPSPAPEVTKAPASHRRVATRVVKMNKAVARLLPGAH